jgi:16S rRNA (guanine966-N2)-methyltransferase
MRVIAGVARGRPLRAPTSARVRPTGDKIKGVIFSMLEAEAYRRGFEPVEAGEEHDGRFAVAVAWPHVLELYAGSGALAIEALSRGAAGADLVETDPAARRAIEENLIRTGLADRAAVHAMTSTAAVSTLRGPYDLILLDPPYDEPGMPTLLRRLAESAVVSPAAVLIWEHRRAVVAPDLIGDDKSSSGWRRIRTNPHGSAAVSLYARATGD